MHRLTSFRAAMIAIVALIFSATIAFAGQPSSHAAQGLANATSHAGKTVPDAASDETSETDESETETSETETDSSESADNCTVDLTGDLSGVSHGSVVCTAAQMDTPDGYANHGAWVSHWARMNHGADASAAGKAHRPSH